MSEWISVKNRLPNLEIDVLVTSIGFNSWYMSTARLFFYEWVSQETDKKLLFDVTHWMPLPNPPSDEEIK